MVNLVAPLFEAVKMSPLPLLSAIMVAFVVLAENEAAGAVAELPRTSSIAVGDKVPSPTYPLK